MVVQEIFIVVLRNVHLHSEVVQSTGRQIILGVVQFGHRLGIKDDDNVGVCGQEHHHGDYTHVYVFVVLGLSILDASILDEEQ